MGKGTVVRRVLQQTPNLVLSVSATTRAPRPGELDGRDYHFMGDAEFDRLADEDGFLEWAEVFGARYGTPSGPVIAELERGNDVLLEIDVQGAGQVRRRRPDATLIFLAPPSEADLVARLQDRR
ncbi:MAG: guanylate kinase, partial [Actinomycetota bacterium]